MNQQVITLHELINKSPSIFITSHISPDADAISSLLLLGTTLKLNHPDKKIDMVLEEEIDGVDFLDGYDQIRFSRVDEELRGFKPDLFILLDGNNYERCSRHNGQKIREFITSNAIKTVIIDHHEPEGADKTDIFINNNSPATVIDVYKLCFDELKLRIHNGGSQMTMTGIYADTGGFVYLKDGDHKTLFNLIEKLISQGAQIEKLKNLLERYSQEDMEVLKELLSNLNHHDEYTYSFLKDEFVNQGHEQSNKFQKGAGIFLNEFVRNIDGRQWGFIVYRNLTQGEDMYSASFRSVSGVKDVSKIAAALGGGGHKPAAGAKFSASSAHEAIAKVQEAIAST